MNHLSKLFFIFWIMITPGVFLSSEEKSITFSAKSLKEGDIQKTSESLIMDIDLNVVVSGGVQGNMEFKTSNTQIVKKNEKILEMNGPNIKKIEVFYDTREETEKTGNDEKKKINPVSGKTYILEFRENKLNITSNKGEVPIKDEMLIIEKDYKNFDDIFTINKLNGKTFKVGESNQQVEDIFKSIFLESLNANELQEFNIVLKDVIDFKNQKCGIFNLRMKLLTVLEENLTMSVNVTGDFLIGINDCKPKKIDLKGPLSLSASKVEGDNKTDMDGKGSLEYKIENE